MVLKRNHGDIVSSCCNSEKSWPTKQGHVWNYPEVLPAGEGGRREAGVGLATGATGGTRTQTPNRRPPWASAGPGAPGRGQETSEGAVTLGRCLFSNSDTLSDVSLPTLLPFYASLICGGKHNISFLQYSLLEASCWNAEIALGMISHSLQNDNSSPFLQQALNCFQY